MQQGNVAFQKNSFMPYPMICILQTFLAYGHWAFDAIALPYRRWIINSFPLYCAVIGAVTYIRGNQWCLGYELMQQDKLSMNIRYMRVIWGLFALRQFTLMFTVA